MKKAHDKLESFNRLDVRSLHKAGYTNDAYKGEWGWFSNSEMQSTIEITTQNSN